ncbi:DUF3748 domain-containing protein [Salmonella enterica subsp. enterica]|nr:DUF3748 domain-containing protein [Salmonella enterica subsp. enterica]
MALRFTTAGALLQRRGGVTNLDAMDITAPYAPGARCAAAVTSMCFSERRGWVSFTYSVRSA